MTALSQSFSLGPIGLTLNQLLIILALAMALLTNTLVGMRYRNSAASVLYDILFVGVIAARLIFVLRHQDDYDSVWAMLDIRDGGFDPLGGAIVASVYTAWRLWRVPEQRPALASALIAGIATWGLAAGSYVLMDSRARSLPEVELTTLQYSPITLSQLVDQQAGQPMVVNLWATWCPPCRREMPVLQAAQQAAEDVTFVFVNQGEHAPTINQFIEHEALDLNNVLLDPGQALGQAVGSQVMPTTLFYDAQGRLQDTHFGELSRASLAAKLEPLR
ncbi:TlpA family protein disulfide reductase [Modicisalibacter luteus]|uniref:TlpA family protein disulfide reductase n=1 Tax=Modicisalibacter luteus TaxID=453962 RepID=A0ABV7M0R5_9GAMM|nr:TlpA disulfide reductase family protein [Halomonas lutea]GHA91820.1 thiol:disulfide interchange protein [Halomonas lutea]